MNKILALFTGIFGSKRWYESLTAWGLVVYTGSGAVLEQVCALGLLEAATCATAAGVLSKVGVVMTALGIRRAVAA